MNPPSFSFSNRLFCAVALVLYSLLFSWMCDLPGVVLTETLIAAAVLTRKRPLQWNWRNVIICLTAAGVAAALQSRFFHWDANNFGFFAMLFQIELYTPMLFYAATLMLLFDLPRYHAGVLAGVLFFTLCGVGDMVNFRRDNSFFPWNPTFMERFYPVVFSLCALMGLMILFLTAYRFAGGAATEENRKSARPRAILPNALRLLLLLILLVLWKSGWDFYVRNERSLRGLEQFVMRFSGSTAGRKPKTSSSNEVNLMRPMPERDGSLDDILLRVDGTTPPGYLRGRAYSSYENGRWRQNSEPNTTNYSPLPCDGDSEMRTFQRKGGHGGHWTVYPASEFESDTPYSAGNWSNLTLISEQLQSDDDGGLHPDEFSPDGGWSFNGPTHGESAWPLPLRPRPDHTAVPDNLKELLRRTTAEIPGLAEAKTDRDRREKIAAWLLTQFHYRIRTRPPLGEPMSDFLTVDRSGHCEYFATASALLARQCGMASRYVTGFICAERARLGEYYIARRDSAHAWTEVFDREDGTWHLLEATPPDGRSSGARQQSFVRGANDGIIRLWRKFRVMLRRGEVALFLRSAAQSPWPYAIFILLVVGLSARRIRFAGSRAAERNIRLSAREYALQKEALRLEKMLSKRLCRRDLAALTVPELLSCTEQSAALSEEEKQQFRTFAVRYANERWRETPEPSESGNG